MSELALSVTAMQPAYAEEPTRFTASVSASRMHTIVVAWDFGDGGHAIGEVVDHVYAAEGPYTVTATAINQSDGTAGQASGQVQIEAARVMAAPGA